jgi:hypothetical protein
MSEAERSDKGAKDRRASERQDALKRFLADLPKVARELRPALETGKLRLLARGLDGFFVSGVHLLLLDPSDPDAIAAAKGIQMLVGLLQLTNPAAIAAVDEGRVPVEAAAHVGHWTWDRFTHEDREGKKFGEEFQAKAIAVLEAGEPRNAVDRIANELVKQREDERRRLKSLDMFNKRRWPERCVLSWITWRDPDLLFEIEDDRDLNKICRYGCPSSKNTHPMKRNPKRLLLEAQEQGELAETNPGWFDSKKVRRVWSAERVRPLTERSAKALVKNVRENNPDATLDNARKAAQGRGNRDLVDRAWRDLIGNGGPLKRGRRPGRKQSNSAKN